MVSHLTAAGWLTIVRELVSTAVIEREKNLTAIRIAPFNTILELPVHFSYYYWIRILEKLKKGQVPIFILILCKQWNPVACLNSNVEFFDCLCKVQSILLRRAFFSTNCFRGEDENKRILRVAGEISGISGHFCSSVHQ